MNLAETLELANDRGLLDWETLPAHGATMADIDPGKVEAHLQRRLESGGQFQRFEDVEQALIGMKCALMRSGGDVVPTNAGILFFGRGAIKAAQSCARGTAERPSGLYGADWEWYQIHA